MTDALQEAVRLHQAGRHAEAETRYRAILAREPANADALHYLGLIQYDAGQWESAAELLQRSVRANDRNAVAWSNLGNALTMVSRLPDAEAAFRSALRIDPGFADASFNLGNALRQQQRLAEAEECYRQAATSNPLHSGALNNLALVQDSQGRKEDAAQALVRLGNVLQDLGRSEDAVRAYLESQDRVPNPGVEVLGALVMPVIPMSVAEMDESRYRVATALTTLTARGIALPDPLRYASSTIFYTAYHGRNDRELRTHLANFYLGASPELGGIAPHCAGYPGPSDRIRVGIVSRYLRPDHPIGKHFGAIGDRLDASRFEVHRFGFGPGNTTASGTTMLPDNDLAEMRERLAQARLDVLFYPDIGMEPCTYFLAFSRLAPVQCVTLGHPVTTGIPNVDYFVSSATLEPRGARQHFPNARAARRPAERDPQTCDRGCSATTRGFRAAGKRAAVRMRAESDQFHPTSTRSWHRCCGATRRAFSCSSTGRRTTIGIACYCSASISRCRTSPRAWPYCRSSGSTHSSDFSLPRTRCSTRRISAAARRATRRSRSAFRS